MTNLDAATARTLGVATDATGEDIAEAVRRAQLHAHLAGVLGLPLDCAGQDILDKVSARLDARASAVSLPAGSTLTQIEAAEAAARERRLAPVSEAGGGSSAIAQTLAEIRDRLPRPLTAEEEEDAFIDAIASGGHYTTTNGRVVGQDSEPDQSTAWK